MSDITKQLGQRIRELRTEQHMSQEELSFKAGISPAHLGQIERALKNPTIDTIAKIAAALDIPIADLFTMNTVTTTPQNATVGKINAQLFSMSEEEQKDILRIIRIFRGYQRKSNLPSELD
ncbi:MAG: helix-turn-helix transcriptional regulator [Oscillospiraceae bacterium]|nr:helix-turn-helix transcriptional regulator [Oscillospiraceae bacterium]